MSILTPVCFIDMSRGRPTRQRAAEDGSGQVPPQADPPVPGVNGGAGVTHAESEMWSPCLLRWWPIR